jgi:hypothetical protein
MSTTTESAPTTTPPVSKNDLKALIAEAATGDTAKIERLLSPFLTSGERLVWCGISSKMGLFPTYDFAFLTDRRVGDLEVTPLTGNLNVEICYLQHIDAFVLSQPSFSILLGFVVVLGYPLCILLAVVVAALIAGLAGIITDSDGVANFMLMALSIVFSLVFMVGWTLLGSSLARRWILRFKKSGLWFKLRGSTVGSLIFADRDKFGMLASLARMVTEQKRLLDKETS